MALKPFNASDLFAFDPAAKRAVEAEKRFNADLKTKNKYRVQTKRNVQAQGDGSRMTAAYDPVTDRAIRAVGNVLGNQNVANTLRDVDANLLGVSDAENAAYNFGRGDGTLGDALSIALSAPAGGLLAKPLGLAARGIGAGARALPGAGLAARVKASRPVEYLTEARPLLDNADDAIETAFTVTPGAQRRITNQRPVVQGLPAPEQRAALPAPGPGLPPLAVKTKGGQWWPNTVIGGTSEGWGRNYSPEYAVNKIIDNQFVGDLAPDEQALRDWFAKAAPRYIKNELGTPEDPLMKLAEQGNLHLADTSPNIWARRSRMSMYDEPIGYFTVPPHESENIPGVDLGELAGGPAMKESQQLLAAAPWLAKAPATDKLYGLTQGANQQLGFHHLLDEMGNALNPQSGLPPELLLDPKSLQRMGLAQASERVGLINNYRAKMAQEAALNAVDNPATQTFKEYTENNPRGLRWVELRNPAGDNVPEGALQEALKYEGDTMGHCVGGYCDDVASGRSRIFSLRDAKGEPHVTVETNPTPNMTQLADYEPELADIWNRYRYSTNAPDQHLPFTEWMQKHEPEAFQRFNQPSIVQIKGKQNRAPKEDYLPFVQDFVKSGQWSNVGDLGNTGLVKLPDGRYITAQQAEQGIAAIPDITGNAVYDPSYLHAMDPEDWARVAPHFQGYARGGHALAVKPCSCDHSLAVR